MKKRHSLPSSFGFAFRGIGQVIKKERNIKIYLFLASFAIPFGLIFGFSKSEWLILVLITSLFLSAEIFNSAIEGICNLLKEELNLDYQATKAIRDISAGATLLLALVSIVLALIIFLPYFISLFLI